MIMNLLIKIQTGGLTREVDADINTSLRAAGLQCSGVQDCRYSSLPDLYVRRVARGALWITVYGWDETRYMYV